MARIYERREGHAEFVASSQSRIELQRNYHLQYFLVKLQVTHDNDSAVFKDEELYSLVNNIEIVANGNENLKQIPFNKLHLNNVIGTGQKGINKIVKEDGEGKVSTIWAMIPFSLMNTIRPHDTILFTKPFSTFDFLINWGSDNSIGTGITVKNARIDVFSSSLINYARGKTEPIMYFKETSLVKEVTSTTNQLTINLPDKKEYKAISIISKVDGKRVDTVIKNIQVKSGTTVICDLDADAVRAKNNFEFKPENTDDLKGCYVMDFIVRGRLSDLLNTITEFNTLELVLDVEKQEGLNNLIVLSDTVETTKTYEV